MKRSLNEYKTISEYKFKLCLVSSNGYKFLIK